MKLSLASFVVSMGVSAVLAGACSHPSEPARGAASSGPIEVSPTRAPRAEAPAPPMRESGQAAFAPAPRLGWIIRSSCRMGGCAWTRYDEVQRTGPANAPDYQLRITQGDSGHLGEYPLSPEGVAIEWDASAQSAEVRCSPSAPHAAIGGRGEALKLNPGGVHGVEQGLANLYFATCHGEYGNDGELSAKFGYNLRQ